MSSDKNLPKKYCGFFVDIDTCFDELSESLSKVLKHLDDIERDKYGSCEKVNELASSLSCFIESYRKLERQAFSSDDIKLLPYLRDFSSSAEELSLIIAGPSYQEQLEESLPLIVLSIVHEQAKVNFFRSVVNVSPSTTSHTHSPSL